MVMIRQKVQQASKTTTVWRDLPTPDPCMIYVASCWLSLAHFITLRFSLLHKFQHKEHTTAIIIMSSTTKTKKKKAKDNHILPKPKRPMSACKKLEVCCLVFTGCACVLNPQCRWFQDNYFFRDQRNEIIQSSGGSDGDASKKKSFQDIGRIIGQRWREIQPAEVRVARFHVPPTTVFSCVPVP